MMKYTREELDNEEQVKITLEKSRKHLKRVSERLRDDKEIVKLQSGNGARVSSSQVRD